MFFFGDPTLDIAMQSQKREIVSAHRFLEIYNTELDNIESVRVIPAPLGSPHFGRLEVIRKSSVFTPSLKLRKAKR
jgi:hypothetical protein